MTIRLCFLGKYKGQNAGTIGHMSSFSFQASKHLTSGEGGMVTTNDDMLALHDELVDEVIYLIIILSHRSHCNYMV